MNWHGNCPFVAMMNERTTQQRHILVVDDEPLVRYTVHMLLEDDGYLIDEAESGPQALAMFEPGKFDMVFTGLLYAGHERRSVGGGDQKAFTQAARRDDHSFSRKTDVFGLPPGGIDSFICKPFEVETLRAAIARFAPA